MGLMMVGNADWSCGIVEPCIVVVPIVAAVDESGKRCMSALVGSAKLFG